MSIQLSITSIAPWVLRIIAALVMLQTLYFKFSGSEESVYIFFTIGNGAVGKNSDRGFRIDRFDIDTLSKDHFLWISPGNRLDVRSCYRSFIQTWYCRKK